MTRAKSATYRHFSAKYLLENLKKAIHNQLCKMIAALDLPSVKKGGCVCVCVGGCDGAGDGGQTRTNKT